MKLENYFGEEYEKDLKITNVTEYTPGLAKRLQGFMKKMSLEDLQEIVETPGIVYSEKYTQVSEAEGFPGSKIVEYAKDELKRREDEANFIPL